MDFGQQRLQQQDAARQMMYQNSGYQFERRDKKTLILDIADVNGSDLTCPLGNGTDFSVDLFEPLIIDKHSEIYLDSFLTHNSLVCDTGDTMAFALKVNEFNINSNSASTSSNQHTFNSIIIPNEHNSTDAVFSCVIHKGKKLNYVCSINPCKLTKLTGKITDLGGKTIYSTAQDTTTKTETRLHYINLTDGVTKHVPAGKEFGFNNGTSPTGTTGFKTAFAMDKNSTDLYFYLKKDTSITDVDTSREIESDPDNGLGVSGTTLTTTAHTHKQGEARFVAEFIIVARE